MKVIFLLVSVCLLLSCRPQPFVPDDDMIHITDSMTSLDLKIGQKVYYQGQEHASVGERVRLITQDEHIIKTIKIQKDYNNPNWENTDGGDLATKTFVIEAQREGSTTISIRHLYRGDVQKERTVSCRVQQE